MKFIMSGGWVWNLVNLNVDIMILDTRASTFLSEVGEGVSDDY